MALEAGFRLAPSQDELEAVIAFRRYLTESLRPRIAAQGDRLLSRDEYGTLLRELSEFGLPSGPIPESAGGLGLNWTTYALLFEELAQVSASVATGVLIQTVVGKFLAGHAPEALRTKYLDALMRGEIVASIAISEPDVGSDVAAAKCRATERDNGYEIRGEKSWISNGEHSDFVVCVARCGVDGADTGLFLIDRSEHGYASRGISKLGLRNTSTAQLFFDGTRVPPESRLSAPGNGLRGVMGVFELARPLVGCVSVGIAQRALDVSIAYALERSQHGKPIAGHQLIQAMLAEMSTDIDAARLLVLRAFDTIDRGERAEVQSAKAKWYATEMAVEVTSKAIQIHGGNGITTDYPVEALFRDARMMTIPDGTTEIQKLVIGRRLTGLRAF